MAAQTIKDWRFWFSAYGRFNRGQYWTGIAGVICLALVLIALGVSLGITRSEVGFFVGVVALYVAILWVQICINTKRLHDLGRSGWWLLGLAVVTAPLHFIGEVGHAPEIGGVASLVALVFAIALGSIAGQAGTNRFDRPNATATPA